MKWLYGPSSSEASETSETCTGRSIGAPRPIEHPHAFAGHFGDVAFVEVDHAPRGREHRRHVGGDEVLAFAQADEQRTADAGADEDVGRVERDDRDGVRADKLAHGTLHGLEQTAARGVMAVHEVRDDLGIGLRLEDVAVRAQRLAHLLVVLDDAVVDHRDGLARDVRMRVGFGHAAVRGPARVPDAEQAGEVFRGRRGFHLRDSADAPHAADVAVEDRHARGIVAAVFEALQSLDQHGNDVALRDGADDAAHVSVLCETVTC